MQVYCLGDIFDTAKVPPIVVSLFFEFALSIKKGIRTLAGNHSLPYHSWENVSDSSFGIIDEIVKAGDYGIAYFDDIGLYSHFNEEMKGDASTGFVFLHRLTFETIKDVPPNVKACSAQDLLNEFPTAKWIFVGDMHKKFCYRKKNRFVINAGSIYRGEADFKDYKPSIYYVDTDEMDVEEILLPDTEDMVEDSYLRDAEERKDRISAFVEGIKNNGAVSLNFLNNLEKAIESNNRLNKETIKVIRELCEDGGE